LTVEIERDLISLIAQLRVNMPAGPNDKNYEKEWLKMTLDFDKIQQQKESNFMMKIVMENLEKAIDFELKLPFKKVRVEMYGNLMIINEILFIIFNFFLTNFH
jgi:hypothetical protein